jgi:hypothetical protein
MVYWHLLLTCASLTLSICALRRVNASEAKCKKLQHRFDEMALELKEIAADAAVKQGVAST